MMKLFVLSLLALAMACVNCEVTADTANPEWVSSKYHNYGEHWGVFAGIVGFLSGVLALGLVVEVWYKSKLTAFMNAQEVSPSGNSGDDY